jgi:uncharacterized YccA/Bax inhibitor family protein
MLSYIKKSTGEFFYALFASFVLFAAIFIFVLLILLPFIAALFVAKSNPELHPIFIFGTIFAVAYIEFFVLSLTEYYENR